MIRARRSHRRYRHADDQPPPTAEWLPHDYVRHGTTNLFAALNVATGQVFGECKPNRNGANFLDFLKRPPNPDSGADVNSGLDNLPTHTTPEVKAWLARNPHVH